MVQVVISTQIFSLYYRGTSPLVSYYSTNSRFRGVLCRRFKPAMRAIATRESGGAFENGTFLHAEKDCGGEALKNGNSRVCPEENRSEFIPCPRARLNPTRESRPLVQS
jgi:hypothetical protein